MPNKFTPIETLLKAAKKGEVFILVDDESRENEGDLVFLGDKCSPKKINFMATHGRGLVCLALDKNQSSKLGLKLMPSSNDSRFSTAFTVSIEARKGVTTGISAYDRSKTILTAIKKNASKNDIVTPGHIFPLVAKQGGVLIRAGHTEASVDIAKLTNSNASAVICEIMNDDGTMAKRDQLFKYAKKHNLKISKIEDLIAYRFKKEKFIKLKTKSSKNFKNTKLQKLEYQNSIDKKKHFVISKIENKENCKVRVLSLKDSFPKDVFKNIEVKKSLNYLMRSSNFALIIINSSMLNEDKNFINFSSSKREFEANLIRNYGVGAQIIKRLGLNDITLVTKSKKRIVGLDGFGITIKKQEIFKWRNV